VYTAHEKHCHSELQLSVTKENSEHTFSTFEVSSSLFFPASAPAMEDPLLLLKGFVSPSFSYVSISYTVQYALWK